MAASEIELIISYDNQGRLRQQILADGEARDPHPNELDPKRHDSALNIDELLMG
jgi:hypothetical protein